MQRPGRIVQVCPPERAEVGPAGKDDAVHVVVAADGANRNRGDAGHVADPVREWGLVAATEARLLLSESLTRRYVDRVHTMGGECARDCDRIFGVQPALVPVHRRHAHRHRPGRGPLRTERIEHLEGVAEPVLQAASILVATHVGERRDEARQEVAVRAMQLEKVKAGVHRHPRRGDELVADEVHVGARHLARDLAHRQVGKRRGGDQVPVARVQRLVHPFPHELGRTLAAGMAELDPDLRRCLPVHELDQPLESSLMLAPVHSGAPRCDAPFT